MISFVKAPMMEVLLMIRTETLTPSTPINGKKVNKFAKQSEETREKVKFQPHSVVR